MTPVILVARRKDFGWRDDLWKFCRQRWSDILPDFSIAEGFHDGPEPFSFSAAINASARTATVCEPDWDVCLYVGADWLADAGECVEACELALKTGQLTFPHDKTALLNEQRTIALLNDEIALDHALRDADWHPNTFSGVVAVPRVLWDAVGGFDERVRTWGFDDWTFFDACNALGGGFQRIPGCLVHLWHKQVRAEREDNPEHAANYELWQRYRAVKNSASGMRALLSEPGGPLFDEARITPA